MCKLSIPANRYDDWTVYDVQRTETDPVFALFPKGAVDTLIQQNIDGIIIGATFSNGNMTFTMTGWRNGNIGSSLTAVFPCPDECENAIKSCNNENLLPPSVKFCKNHIETVLTYPGMSHVVVRHKNGYLSLGTYPAIQQENGEFDHRKLFGSKDYIFVAD